MSDGKYRPMFQLPSFEVCSVMNGTSKVHSLIKMIIGFTKIVAPQFFHVCPYYGLHAGKNLTFLTPLMAMYQVGKYRFRATVTDKTSEILVLILDFVIVWKWEQFWCLSSWWAWNNCYKFSFVEIQKSFARTNKKKQIFAFFFFTINKARIQWKSLFLYAVFAIEAGAKGGEGFFFSL
jgi:hypothetical protein